MASRFSRFAEGNSTERYNIIVKTIITKKVATLYKYVIYFYIEICFVETKVDLTAWLLCSAVLTPYFHTTSCPQNDDFLSQSI